ncbi:CBS domain-containing protein [Halanaerobacter jeridensis]|uniref:CBS domain-containing protein n=1 Tax=Halanaerobacter jeridensis TaxID=706427 RepID=A0A939BQ50_9FIRM|nr:CBS domain-containing protein [Halanaerobacter jeridensis]MBM7557693.1 CBS domain-containing protein [Halanaerobacter jeridensis]
MKASEIMTTNVVTVSPEDTVKEVAKVLTEEDISGVPVVEDNELVGIVSEGDLVAHDKKLHFPNYVYFLDSVFYLESFEKFEQDLKKVAAVKIKDIMTEDVVTISPETTVEDIATLLTDEGINRLPVIEDGEMIGIVSRADIVKYMSE